jgi:integrase
MNGKVSTAVVLFKKRKKKNGKYPAKLRLTHERKQMYYTIDTKDRIYEFSIEEFEKIVSPKPRGVFKEIQLEFSVIEEKANRIIKAIGDFTFDKFKVHFAIKGTNMRNIYYFLDLRINRYNKTGYGNKTTITAKRQLQAFFKKKDFLDFKDITVSKLHEFEYVLRERGLKSSTIASYFGVIQAVFNEAHRENVIPINSIPFGRDKYQIASSSGVKRALKISDIEKIYKYSPKPFTHEQEAHDLWMFTYLCNGINMTDICNLRYRNITPDFIHFIRKKTEHKSSIARPVTIPLTDDIKKIIDRQGNKDKSPDNYIFPFINDNDTRKQQIYKIAWRVRKTNVHMQKIGKKLGIEQNITTYTARHSFATVLKRSGVSIAFISESLGHKDVGITETYLDSFGDEKKKEIAKFLTNF